MMGTFKILFLHEAIEFLERLDAKSRRKVLFNLNKMCLKNDVELLKKIHNNIWEFRTLYANSHIRIFAFWDKSMKEEYRLIFTHGIIKQSKKIPMIEIRKAEKIRRIFLHISQ